MAMDMDMFKCETHGRHGADNEVRRANLSLENTIVRTMGSDAQISHKQIDHKVIGKHKWHTIRIVNKCLQIVAKLNSPISHSQPFSVHEITRYNVHKMSAR